MPVNSSTRPGEASRESRVKQHQVKAALLEACKSDEKPEEDEEQASSEEDQTVLDELIDKASDKIEKAMSIHEAANTAGQERAALEKEYEEVEKALAVQFKRSAPIKFPSVITYNHWMIHTRQSRFGREARSKELAAVDLALSQYDDNLQRYNKIDYNEDILSVKVEQSYHALVDATDAWVLKEGSKWSESSRGKQMLFLRQSLFSVWVPPSTAGEVLTAYKVEQETMAYFCQILLGRQLENRVSLAWRKAKEAAKAGRPGDAADQLTRGAQSAQKQGESAQDLLKVVGDHVDPRELFEALAEEVRGVLVKINAFRKALKNRLKELAGQARAEAEKLLAGLKALKEILCSALETLKALLKLPRISVDLELARWFQQLRALLVAFWDWLEAVASRFPDIRIPKFKLPRLPISELVEAFEDMLAVLRDVWGQAKELLKGLQFNLPRIKIDLSRLRELLDAVLEQMKAEAKALQEAIDAAVDEVKEEARAVRDALREIAEEACKEASEFVTTLRGMINGFKHAVARLAKRVFLMLANLLCSVLEGIEGIGRVLVDMFRRVVELFKKGLSIALEALGNLFAMLFGVGLFDLFAGMIPYVGTVLSMRKCGKGWYSAYKKRKSQKRIRKAASALAQSDVIQALRNTLEEHAREEFHDAVLSASAATVETVFRVATDITMPIGAVALGVASAVGKAAVGLHEFVSMYEEAKEVNRLIAQLKATPNPTPASAVAKGNEDNHDQQQLKSLAARLQTDGADNIFIQMFDVSPLLCSYMLCLGKDRMLLNLQFIKDGSLADQRAARVQSGTKFYGEGDWAKSMARNKRSLVDLRIYARKIIRNAHWTIDGLEELALRENDQDRENAFNELVKEKATDAAKDKGKEALKSALKGESPLGEGLSFF